MKTYSVFVCEAEPVAVVGLHAFFASADGLHLSGSAPTPSVAIPLLTQLKPDILLMDHTVGIRTSIQFLGELKYVSEATACVLWTREVPESELVRAFQAGARGFVRKSSSMEVLHTALLQVGSGETFLEESASDALREWSSRRHLPRLTPREAQIIDLVGLGLKNREIAERLQITPGTVKVHLMHIFEKTGARDRYELAVQGSQLRRAPQPVLEVRRTA